MLAGLITFLLAIAMLLTGTMNTLSGKYSDLRVVKGTGDGPPTNFEHPFYQTGAMFIGELSCLFVYFFTLTAAYKFLKSKLLGLFSKSKDPIQTATHTGLDTHQYINESQENISLLQENPAKGLNEEVVTNQRYTNPLLFLIPAACDLGGTTLMNLGLIFTYASVFQMLRGILVVFNAILAVIFLKQKLFWHHWGGILLITIGTGMVGLSSFLNKNNANAPKNPTLGNILVICAQFFAAVQCVVEEAILNKYPAQPLQVVGYEGFWGLCLVTIVLFILYFIPGSDAGSVENFVYATAQVGRDWKLLLATIGSIVSIAFFNFFGITITQRISSTTRSAIDSCRTLFIWVVSLIIGWEVFDWLQLGGFAVLVVGTFIFNEVIRIPYYHQWYLRRKAQTEEQKK
ncbi:solute carrier family 35 member [Acrasis kona]|uniref:Solute carrier family 35 member n=1 Tax=Acrasis kona TaxID=1008807 RepID=A0AAW2ZNR0_9EUKA